MKRKQGISLIVLVITIIVMIILASSVVITLSSNGIIERAKHAVHLTDEKQVGNFATLMWTELYSEGIRDKFIILADQVQYSDNTVSICNGELEIIFYNDGNMFDFNGTLSVQF